MHGTTPGGTTPGMDGAGATLTGTAAGPGTTPGTALAGIATATGALTTVLIIMAGTMGGTTTDGAAALHGTAAGYTVIATTSGRIAQAVAALPATTTTPTDAYVRHLQSATA